jgi:hypothetical protein
LRWQHLYYWEGPMGKPQRQLEELLERFHEEHPELSDQLMRLPAVTTPAVPPGFRATVSTGTDTKPSGLAFLGSGTSGSN